MRSVVLRLLTLFAFLCSCGFVWIGMHVGNLSWNTNDDTLRQAFGEFGQVLDSIVMRDRETGRSRGFGFVTFSNEAEAQNAMSQMNEQELDGRRIKVNSANQRGGGRAEEEADTARAADLAAATNRVAMAEVTSKATANKAMARAASSRATDKVAMEVHKAISFSGF
ncbi:unnamed protein product [Rhizoctonia solani]|uniref:RRM domain-containing protein n=1 Tax=Rhizoctonia solani TaxID=456999 RepID=A0A8H3BXS0_9AGAM|nr:unnamed protein product [Rhizoctonia solani]